MVFAIISSMNVDKAPGFDGISVGSLKCCALNVSSFLCDIFNLSLFYGVYPDQLKIVPVYKKEAKDEVSNYRPISILPAVNKIFETFIQRAVYSFLNGCNFFNKRQYGFREGTLRCSS